MAIKLRFFFFCLIASLAAQEKWEPTQLIWNFGLIFSCDRGVPKNLHSYFQNGPLLHLESYKNIKRGNIVWVPPRLLAEFYQKVFPSIQVPFVLVISDGDHSFPSDCLEKKAFEKLLSDEKVMHIFAQNCDCQMEKISPIPIGIDFHTVASNGTEGGWGMVGSPQEQEELLLQLFQEALPTSQRKCRAFVDFHHSDTLHGNFKRYLQFGEDRRSIFETLLPSRVIDHGPWMPRGLLWKTKTEYAFSISPHGNGLDCHRTWEDLALGCIVIVKSSPLDPLYEGLPVVIVQDWKEINEKNLQKWIVQYADASSNPAYREKLTHKYWRSKITHAAQSHLFHN